MKYVHIIGSLDSKYGGPTVVVLNLALAQKKLGHDVSIISTYLTDNELNNVQNEFKKLTNILLYFFE